MKQVVRNYTFNTSTRAVTLTDYVAVSLDRLALIVNNSTNRILWNLADPTIASASVAGNTFTLSALPGGDSNTDKLSIFYDALPADGPVFLDGQTPTARAAVAYGGFSYTNITANTTTVVKGSSATLRSVSINTRGTGESTVVIYDNASTATGARVATIDAASIVTSLEYDVACSNGIVVVTAGMTAPDVTVTWK